MSAWTAGFNVVDIHDYWVRKALAHADAVYGLRDGEAEILERKVRAVGLATLNAHSVDAVVLAFLHLHRRSLPEPKE